MLPAEVPPSRVPATAPAVQHWVGSAGHKVTWAAHVSHQQHSAAGCAYGAAAPAQLWDLDIELWLEGLCTLVLLLLLRRLLLKRLL